ncbi:MAG: transglutaminase-like cysteine peptidase [Pseudomonadota bacterium]
MPIFKYSFGRTLLVSALCAGISGHAHAAVGIGEEGSSISNTQTAAAANTIRDSVFGTAALSFSAVKTRSEWQRVRANVETSIADGVCFHGLECEISEDTGSLNGGTGLYQTLNRVNRIVNDAITYREDYEAYGHLDYWAHASETARNGYGDCEDFAILKYAMLRALGVPAESLSLVVLKDKDRNLYHAVLAVNTNQGYFILDNLSDQVLADGAISHYQPLYSFAAERSFLHGKPLAQKTQFASMAGPTDASLVSGIPIPSIRPAYGDNDASDLQAVPIF